MKKYLPDILSTVLLLLAFVSSASRHIPVMNVIYWIFAVAGTIYVAWILFFKSLELFEKIKVSYYTGVVLLLTLALCVSFGIKVLAGST